MQASIQQFQQGNWQIHPRFNHCNPTAAQLVLCFADKSLLADESCYSNLKQQFPAAEVALCSTAGEIFQEAVQDDSLVAVSMCFDNTSIKTAVVNISNFNNSFEAAEALIQQLSEDGLVYVMVLSDGSLVNGSELVKGFNQATQKKVLVTGGLAGDGNGFNSTLVGLNQLPVQGNIVAVGFYGDSIVVKHGSNGGWQTFGTEKTVTRSTGNKLFELDEKNALDLYKRYLGPEAENLPGSALLFPLSVTIPGASQPVVRTILSIDNDEQSMTFAGDIPEGSQVRFMKSNLDMLTGAAFNAAQNSLQEQVVKPSFSMLVSCVGRKIILDVRTEEEVEAVLESFGTDTPIAGFYSYGEIAPFNEGGHCQLHNQTMTITSFYEFA